MQILVCSIFKCDSRECEHAALQWLHGGTSRHTGAEDRQTNGASLLSVLELGLSHVTRVCTV